MSRKNSSDSARSYRKESEAVLVRQALALQVKPESIKQYIDCNQSTIYNLAKDDWKAFHPSDRDLTEPDTSEPSNKSIWGLFTFLLDVHREELERIRESAIERFEELNSQVRIQKAAAKERELAQLKQQYKEEGAREAIASLGITPEMLEVIRELATPAP